MRVEVISGSSLETSTGWGIAIRVGIGVEVVLELGVPQQLNNGTLLFSSTSTPPSDAGAIELADYSMDLIFTPSAR